jgi:hypothetical protein
MAFLGGLAASILAPALGNVLGGGGGLLGGVFGGGGGGGTQSQNGQGNAPPPDQAPYYGATIGPQYDQSALIQQKQAAQDASDAKLALVQIQAQSVIAQQQAATQLEKMKVTAQLSQQSAQLQQAQAQLAASQAKASSSMDMLPYLAVGAVLLVVLLK